MISIDNALRGLLNRLDEIASEHSEIFDTAVREELGWSVYQSFILGKDYDFGGRYAMLSSEAYEKIALALLQFVKHPDIHSVNYSTITPQQRLDAFQDSSIVSLLGSKSWQYFGHIELPCNSRVSYNKKSESKVPNPNAILNPSRSCC